MVKRNVKVLAEKAPVQVISRAIAILRTLENQPDGLSLGEIAQRLDLARSTVQRIVSALTAEQVLIAASPTRNVRLGPTLLRLASSVPTDIGVLARSHLQSLSNELGETVDLAAIKRDYLVFIDQVIGPHRLRAVSAVGERFPLHCTANGKAFLAQLDDPVIEQLIGRKFEKRTQNSITSLPELLKELKAVRKTGVAFDREEHTLGICAVGAAFRDPLGNPIAISVPVPESRFHGRETFIAERLLDTLRGLNSAMN